MLQKRSSHVMDITLPALYIHTVTDILIDVNELHQESFCVNATIYTHERTVVVQVQLE